MSASKLQGLVVAMAIVASGCFYADPINTRPQARLEVAGQDGIDAPIHRGDAVTASASKSFDDDDDRLFYDFAVWGCGLDGAECSRVSATVDAGDFRASFNVPTVVGEGSTVVESVRIELFVEDVHGAVSTIRQVFPVVNRGPEVLLQAQGNSSAVGEFPLGAPITVAASVDDPDEDALELAWRVIEVPGASMPNAYAFEQAGADPLVQSLLPDVAGRWVVRLTVTDSSGAVGQDDVVIFVANDAHPCVIASDPLASEAVTYVVESAGAARRFAVVTVADDLDPFPGIAFDEYSGETAFEWTIRGPDDIDFVTTGGVSSDYLLDPLDHQPGDQLILRVNALDREAEHAPVCVDDFCSFDGGTCYQRVAWKVVVQ